MAITHEMYDRLFKAATEKKQFDKTELYDIITPENINDTDDNGCTLLHIAASQGDVELVKFLLGNDADITIKDDVGLTALRYAIDAITEDNFVTQDKIIKCFLQKNANIDEEESNLHFTALHNAAISGQLVQAQILLANGASLDALTYHQKTARHIVEESANRNKAEMLRLFDTPLSTINALTSGHSIFSSINQQLGEFKPIKASETAEPEQPIDNDKDNSPPRP